MARYKEEFQGVVFDISINTEAGNIRIQAEGIRSAATYNQSSGKIGKIETHFDSLERMTTSSPLLAELFQKAKDQYFTS